MTVLTQREPPASEFRCVPILYLDSFDRPRAQMPHDRFLLKLRNGRKNSRRSATATRNLGRLPNKLFRSAITHRPQRRPQLP